MESLVARAPARGSAFYRRFGDARAFLWGPHALLLQTMHPVVGAGVVEHSNFRQQAWRRLHETLLSTSTWAYGGPEGVELEARRLRQLHTGIAGTMPDGSRYTSLAPAPWAWVYATLVRGSADAQQYFGRPLPHAELEEYYRGARELGLLLGVREQDLPETWDAFLAYFDDTVDNGLEHTEAADQVVDFLQHIPRPKPLRFVLPHVVWRVLIAPLSWLVMVVTAGTLPASVRERLGLPWSPGRRRALGVYRWWVRLTFAVIPPPFRRVFGVVTGRANTVVLRRRSVG